MITVELADWSFFQRANCEQALRLSYTLEITLDAVM